ncbi:hypothetical protein FA15DRAFT_707537 [Coprinopsis marcescibilis]|uniref:Ricin B lectin domain-containing protein n=1 Tax=Coprinopsis marcescibilis TaxID=230819 RepID=A0A5C3KYP0_COPMA|nr:hypothetical protein FA15DRAFT_707537 [Coprinopsis marcescibilis]
MVQLKDGEIYSLISTRFRAVVELEDWTKCVVLHDFTGSVWQKVQSSFAVKPHRLGAEAGNAAKWTAIKAGEYWKSCNVGLELYLGIDIPYSPSNNLEIVGTLNNEFLWKVEPKTSSDHPTALQLFVPYTRFCLDASTIGSLPRVKVQFWEGGQHALVVNPHVEPVVPCINGTAYKIVNAKSGTVAHLESNGNVCGHEYNEGHNQLWEAIQEGSNPYLYSFKNILNGLHLGVKGNIPKNEVHIVKTKKAFRWCLVANSFDSSQFQ